MAKGATPLVLTALTVVSMGYAGHHLVSKIAAQQGDSLIIAAWRALLGTAVMYIAAYFIEGTQRWTDAGRDLRSFVPLGIFMAGNVTGFLMGVEYLSALTCSVMQPLVPAVSAVLCLLFGVEDVSLTKYFSIVLSIAGAVIVLTHGELAAATGAASPKEHQIGTFFICMNVISNACYWVYQKQVLKKYKPVTATATAYLYASAIIFTVALVCRGPGDTMHDWALHLNPVVAACLTYIVFISTAFNYCVQGWANSQTTPTTVTMFMTLPPFFATLISAVFLNIMITMGQAVGGLAIAIGLVLSVKAQHEAEMQDPELLKEFNEKDFA